jgi:hypothetical protein
MNPCHTRKAVLHRLIKHYTRLMDLGMRIYLDYGGLSNLIGFRLFKHSEMLSQTRPPIDARIWPIRIRVAFHSGQLALNREGFQ